MKRVISAVLFTSVLIVPNLFGQAADGNIVGAVIDATGAAVVNATVELVSESTNVKNTASTDATGSYRFLNVLVGTYRLTVMAPGFTTATLQGVQVELNKTTTANVSLEVGAVTSQVEVTEAAVLLDTTTAQVTNTYDSRLAADLPMAANRDGGIYNLALVGAGVGSSGGVGVGYGPSVGGQRPRNNNFTVDGVDNNRKDVTGPVIFIPNDAVAEFTVLQNQFSAEFGHSSGGQFNAVIKSGGNQLHGGIYEYLQNRDLFANDQAAARINVLSPPRYDNNRLGGEAGGPIIKNKWFIYGLFEYNPVGQAGVLSSPVYSPTQAGYGLLDAMAANGSISKTNLGILEKYAAPAPTQSRTTSVNNVSIPTGILPVVAPSFSNTYTWLVSSDFNISDKDQLRVRYVDSKVAGIDIAATLPAFFFPRPTTTKLGTVSEFHDFRPNLANELRLAINRYNDNIEVPNFNFPGLDVFPNVVIRNDLNFLNIGPDPNAPQATIQTTYQIADNLSWTVGKHDLKFGFDGRDLIAASTFIQRVRGDYEYTSLERYLLDWVPDYIAERNVGAKPYSGNDTAYYWYANDNWRFNRHLTLNLGIRYEFNGVAQSMREFALNSIADVPGVLTFRAPVASKNNFAPRIGFAYSPGNTGKTSIRGGFGMAYDQIFDNVGTNARPPQATSTIDSPVSNTPGYLGGGGILSTAVAGSLTPAQARAGTSSYLPPNQQLGYALTWNFGVQHEFARDYTVEVRYLGTKGVHLLFQNQINRAAVVTPSVNLPTFMQTPTAAQLAGLNYTLQDIVNLRNTPGIGNTMAQYGFTSNITAYLPLGNSHYHGLALELKKRFAKNLQFDGAYTWSHNIDDSTAEVASIVATPRRPQDFNNISAEKASSALDRRQRFTFTALYQTPWFRDYKNWAVKNVLGNWEASGTYTAETGELATPQSGVDTNENGDSAADRVILNPSGAPGTSSDVTPINKAGQPVPKGNPATAAYVALNPNAQYIEAYLGTLANSGRNILSTPGINNIDFSIQKIVSIRERVKFQLRADLFNALNHPQYTLGRINNVRARNTFGNSNQFVPGNPLFGQWDQAFSSNPRIVQIGAKLTF